MEKGGIKGNFTGKLDVYKRQEPGIYLPHFPGYFYAGFGEHDA